MQPLTWYYYRLKTMPPSEIAWRVQRELHGIVDRARFRLGRLPAGAQEVLERAESLWQPAFSVTDLEPGEWLRSPAADETAWLAALRKNAAEVAAHRISYFDLQGCDLGTPIDWHRDHSLGRASPRGYSPDIDYRDLRVAGDCKLVWEPNRHHQFVVLARASRASGDPAYATAMRSQMADWLDANPYATGMNWRSGLELGIRLINWVWALDLTREVPWRDSALRARVLQTMWLMCRDNVVNFSRGSSANNHLIGEAAGVFIATCYFPQLPNAARWREESGAIIARELMRQSHPDGCSKEQAPGYQLFVLEFFITCGLVARWTGREFPPEYWSRIEKMLEFVGHLAEAGGRFPAFNDNDDGYVLDLGRTARDARDLLAAGAVLFRRSDFAAGAGSYREYCRWLLGRSSRQQFGMFEADGARALASVGFPHGGHYLLQCGQRGAPDSMSVTFDCAEIGLEPMAAHGHADALAITLRVGGRDVLVDPGTYDYFTYPEWRNYFRSTRAHNTLEIDGVDQSEILGPFMWGRRAHASCLAWTPDARGGGTVCGEHDGYARLPGRPVHRRSVRMDADRRRVEVEDELDSTGAHAVALYFHLAEDVVPHALATHRFELRSGSQRIGLEFDPALEVTCVHASESPICGWVSPSYHRRLPSHTFVARAHTSGTAQFRTVIALWGA